MEQRTDPRPLKRGTPIGYPYSIREVISRITTDEGTILELQSQIGSAILRNYGLGMQLQRRREVHIRRVGMRQFYSLSPEGAARAARWVERKLEERSIEGRGVETVYPEVKEEKSESTLAGITRKLNEKDEVVDALLKLCRHRGVEPIWELDVKATLDRLAASTPKGDS